MMNPDERKRLQEHVISKVHERMTEKMGKEKAKEKGGMESTRYCCDPFAELIAEYMQFIQHNIEEDEAVARMLDTKDLDIAKLKQENEKFLHMNK